MKKNKISVNYIYYLFKRNNWIFDFRRYFINESIKINSPIFLFGNQGGGLTLLSRMLRRNRKVVSVTGNYKYWSGADELQNVMGPILPAELTGIKYKAPKHETLTPPRSWSYGTDELVNMYKKSEHDYTKKLEIEFKNILKYILYRYGRNIQGARFVDKSQVYTVRLGLIYELMKDCNPKFVLVTRNPYAECYRAANGKAGDMERYKKFLSWEERLELCAQHWSNCMGCILEDKERLGIDVLVVQMEDILSNPEMTLRKICDFVEIEFDKDMIPQEYHKIPFGSNLKERWYPLRAYINESYLNKIEKKDIEIINRRCETFIRKLGYEIIK